MQRSQGDAGLLTQTCAYYLWNKPGEHLSRLSAADGEHHKHADRLGGIVYLPERRADAPVLNAVREMPQCLQASPA